MWEYGSGQPWNRRLGYDLNGDGRNSDRAPGVERNSEDGPRFTQLNLRLTKAFSFSASNRLDVIVEAFNLFDTTNYDVNSINSAEFLAAPTATNPAIRSTRTSATIARPSRAARSSSGSATRSDVFVRGRIRAPAPVLCSPFSVLRSPRPESSFP